MSRTLILSTCYVSSPSMRDLVVLWSKLMANLNPSTDILLVDSASPINPAKFLYAQGFRNDADYYVQRRIWSFDDNLGHLSRGGKDGWGRAFCRGIEIAADAAKSFNYAAAGVESYDYVAYMDADILCRRPVAPVIERMAAKNIKICCPMDFSYQFVENGICFMNLEWLIETKFCERYDWQNPVPTTLPEYRFEALAGDELWLLSWRGMRNDRSRLTPQNLNTAYDYVTHCQDMKVYTRFLEINGLFI